jgi:hypothetical protein
LIAISAISEIGESALGIDRLSAAVDIAAPAFVEAAVRERAGRPFQPTIALTPE